MIGRKKNRRRPEPRAPWLKLPTIAPAWRRRVKLGLALPLAAAALFGLLRGRRSAWSRARSSA